MNYQDLKIEISYKSVGESSFSKILNPLLHCTKSYKRSVGFFSSSAFDFIGDGVTELAKNYGHISLATCPRLNSDDIEAIKMGYDSREISERIINEKTKNILSEMSDENVMILYQLVKEKILDIKIVLKDGGIYHDKLAILEDFDGNKIACVGSNNESEPGYNSNYEKIRVYKSWTDFEGRIKDESDEFESIWNKKNEHLKIYDFTDAFNKELLVRVKKCKNNSKKQQTYEKRQYQIDASNNWNNNDHKGFFIMATGTGKTFTSLMAINNFINNNKILTVIVVPYKHLVSQWYEDATTFLKTAYIIKVHGEIKDAETQIYSSYRLAKNDYKPIIVITTIKSFFIEKYKNLYSIIKFDKLLIVDEAHNFINFLSDNLAEQYKYKLGLSATPVFGSDEKKTKLLTDWFGGVVENFPIENAIGEFLVNYEYHPIFVNATPNDEEEFSKYTKMMARAYDSKSNKIIDNNLFTIAYRGRLRSISMAKEKNEKIQYIFNQIKEYDHTIIYCSDGKLIYNNDKNESIRHLESILKLINYSILNKDLNLKASKFTAAENIEQRMTLIDDFNKKRINYLVAIRCLDEGINIPSIKNALLLSSNDNYREFVQRRGRILRKYEDPETGIKKEIAHIYDVIVLPSLENKSFAEIEFRRFYEYSKLAKNKDEMMDILEKKLNLYKMSLEDVKFKNTIIYEGELDE